MAETAPGGRTADQGPDAEMQNPTGDAPQGFRTDEVSASRGREQGLGMGERELAAQRDAGVEMTADVEGDVEEVADDDQDGVEELDGEPTVETDPDAEDTASGV